MPKAKTTENPWASDFNIKGLTAIREEVQSQGVARDTFDSDGKTYTSNFRRICPKRPDWEYPFQVIPVHFGVGPTNRTLGCPRVAKTGDCPLCTLGFDLIRGGDKEGGKDMLSKIRIYLNVVHVKGDGSLADEKVFLLSLNQTQFFGGQESDEDEILADIFEQVGDISHIETGRNIDFRAKLVKRGRFEFNRVKYAVVADATPFPGSLELLETIHDLPNVVTFVDAAEMVNIYEGKALSPSLLAPGTTHEALPAPAETELEVKATVVKAEPVPAGGFNTQVEEPEEEEVSADKPEEAKVTATPPQTDPQEAISRLRANVQNGGSKGE